MGLNLQSQDYCPSAVLLRLCHSLYRFWLSIKDSGPSICFLHIYLLYVNQDEKAPGPQYVSPVKSYRQEWRSCTMAKCSFRTKQREIARMAVFCVYVCGPQSLTTYPERVDLFAYVDYLALLIEANNWIAIKNKYRQRYAFWRTKHS